MIRDNLLHKRMVMGFLTTALCPLVFATPAAAAAADAAAPDTDDQSRGSDIVVTGAQQTTDKQSASATGLALSLKETPQSVTVINQQRIQDFRLTNVNDLLAQTVGINVERFETDRTTYNSRGFDITNFQVDGIGLPLFASLQTGDLDTALFERVEAVRGANAIMTGIGNPSATINYLRKRPTPTFQAHLSVDASSWDGKRVQADVSGPLNASGTLQARAIYAHDDHDSYLDYYHVNRNVYGGIIAWNVTPRLKATVGYTRQDNKARGNLWGSLPLVYTDGTRIDYPVSATTAADWTYWNTHDQTIFGELAYDLGGSWSVRGVATYNNHKEAAKLLYAFGNPDRETGLGIAGMSGVYPSTNKQYLYDAYASGPVTIFGREQQLAFGFSRANQHGLQYEGFSDDAIDYGDVRNRIQPIEPTYPTLEVAADTRDTLTRAYGAAHLNITDQLKAVVGATAIWLKSSGASYDVDQSRKNSKISPYAGLLFDVTKNITLYASYTDIFNPQSQVDVGNSRLAPAKGTSIEGGIKSEWLDGRLYATASVFKAKQSGLASFAGIFDGSVAGQIGNYYEGVDTRSKGFEFEMSGKVTDQWTLSGGFTHVTIKDDTGAAARTFIPRNSLKISTTYSIPDLRDLKLGAQLRYQSSISSPLGDLPEATDVTINQGKYAIVDLLAAIRVIDHVRATINVRNVTNHKYINSLEYGSGFYAAPRSFVASLNFDY